VRNIGAKLRLMVTQRDRERMRLIGRALDELNREAVAQAARRSPSENIELGLRLGDAALVIAQHAAPRPAEVAPIQLWRARQRRAGAAR
jgi:hypothetical protein